MKANNKLRHERYDRFQRDKNGVRFYHSAQWMKVREMKLRRNPLCEACEQAGIVRKADMVHHLIPVKEGTHKLDREYLVSLCHACHNKIETEIEKEKALSA